MTDTQLTMVIGFAGTFTTLLGSIAAQFFQGWKNEQALKQQSLDIQRQAQQNAGELARKTEATARLLATKTEQVARTLSVKTDEAVQTIKEGHDALLAAQTENTRLTIVGNDIKGDILKNQEAIADTQKDVSALKNQINGNS